MDKRFKAVVWEGKCKMLTIKPIELCYLCKKKPKKYQEVCEECHKKIDDAFDRMREDLEEFDEKNRGGR